MNRMRGLVLIMTLGLVGFAASVEASHFRGAAMVPSVSATGLLTVTATSFWRPTAVADIDEGGAINVSGVGAMTQVGPEVIDTSDARFTKVTSVHTIQLPGAGTYAMSATSCCRVGGIINAAESTWTMNSSIAYNGSSANTPIQFNFSAVQPEVIKGTDYNGNLGAVAGPGLSLSYNQTLNENINSQPPGFTVNAATGALNIPAASTATYGDNPTANIGADYAFSGNIIASDGSSVEFDWLFDAVARGTGNLAPQVTDAIINIILGDTASHTFIGMDPEGSPLTWMFVNFFGPGAPAIAPIFDPLTQLFTWDSTGSMLGVYQAQVQASDGLLTDIGTLTINVTNGTAAVPEPATLLLVGSGIAAAARYRRKKTAKTV